MKVVNLYAAGGPPVPGSAPSVRLWLTTAIEAAADRGCGDCGPRRPCPQHAADGVISACLQERLFIMPTADADAIIELAVGRRMKDLTDDRHAT